MVTENEIATIIVDCAFKVQVTLSPGLMESVYESAMAYELTKRGLKFARQVSLPVMYDGIRLEGTFKMDLVIENLVVIELKSVEIVVPVHKKQLLTYLRLADKKLGLLINFGEAYIKNGITRVVNGL